jgi:hypothetical protein
MGGTSAGTAGGPVSVSYGGAPESAGGFSTSSSGVPVIAGSMGGAAVGGNGAASGDAAGNGGEAGGAPSDSNCSLTWGTPNDPGYRGLRGTFDGQALSVDEKDMLAGIAFCFQDGPGRTPDNLTVYIPLPGMSLWIDNGCQARITSPEDTTWHELDTEVSAAVAMPAMNTTAVRQPSWEGSAMSGHLRLLGQAASGTVTIDADFYLDLGVGDPCAPVPPPIR